MRRKTFWQRRREARETRSRAAVPDQVRSKADAEQQMRFFDQLGPESRQAIRETRFDDDAVERWHNGYRFELKDQDLAKTVRRDDDNYSGRFGPRAPAGI